VNGKVVEQ